MDILTELYTISRDSKERDLIVEVGAILKGSMNASYNKPQANQTELDAEKLLADNQQLFEENHRLINDMNTLNEQIINGKLPSIENGLKEIYAKFNDLTNFLKTV